MGLNRKYGNLITRIRTNKTSSTIKIDKIAEISLYIKNIHFNETLLNNLKKDIEE
jgi:hypothetical protein